MADEKVTPAANEHTQKQKPGLNEIGLHAYLHGNVERVSYVVEKVCIQAAIREATPELTIAHKVAEDLCASYIADALIAVDELRAYLLALKGGE